VAERNLDHSQMLLATGTQGRGKSFLSASLQRTNQPHPIDKAPPMGLPMGPPQRAVGRGNGMQRKDSWELSDRKALARARAKAPDFGLADTVKHYRNHPVAGVGGGGGGSRLMQIASTMRSLGSL
jgi:hypothetical protein